jgi:hypothetical protein
MKEWDNPVIFCLRLKVADGKIAEVEDFVVRDAAAAKNLDAMGAPNPKLIETIPPAERESREELVKTANMYFSGLQNNDGKGVYPFAPDRNRIENATQTCPSTFGALSKDGKPTSCAEGLDSHIFEYIYPISPRRYQVIDRQRGIVMGNFMFNTSGKVDYVNVPGVGKVRESAGALRPFSEVVCEIFKLKDNQIDSIIAVMTGLPYGDTSGWQ